MAEDAGSRLTCLWSEVAPERFESVTVHTPMLTSGYERQKIKKSLGPDFLDPTELNSQMKHKLPDALKAVADIEKVYSDEATIRCSQCNQKGETLDLHCFTTDHPAAWLTVLSGMDKEVLTDSLSRSVKWICPSCRQTDSRTCCFCGDGEAEFLCPSCEPGVCKSFHRKCIPDSEPGAGKCNRCAEEGQIVESPGKEETAAENLAVPDFTVVPGDSLVEETKLMGCSAGINQHTEIAKETEVVPAVPETISGESEGRGPLRSR